MPTKSPELEIEQIPGDLYPDLESAQRVARPALAADLVEIVRAMLEAGVLELVNGKIIPTRIT